MSSVFWITIEGKRNGYDGTFYFVVEGDNEDDAIRNASDLQSVKLLDEVYTVNGKNVQSNF